jgi:hypothetical protein
MATIGFDVIKPVRKAQVIFKLNSFYHLVMIFDFVAFIPKNTFRLSLRTVTNWRQIIKLPTFEYCSILKLGTLLPILAQTLQKFRLVIETYLGIVKSKKENISTTSQLII